ncbi:MAG: transglutaminase domain-containing protein, partial [Clostridia bacterium]
ISSYAFGNCNINKFYLSVSVPPEIALNSFYNMTEYVIYVDADNVDTYKNDSCWSVYSTNITAKLLVGNGFIPYISEFTSNDIIIDSYEELQAYIEFISFNYITAETRTTGQQSIEITYIANSQISGEIDNAIKLSTFANNSGIGYSTYSTTYSFYISHDNRSSEASLTAATTDANKQIGNMIYEEIESTRASDFDDFKVNNKVLTVDVATSNQLLYVLEHGYVPLAEVGSNAELMYNKAKDVLKDIITDDMSDYEKVKAIYMWLVMDVAYDYDVLDLNTIEWWNYDAYYLEGVFNNERAVCDGISKAFSVLANIEGISAVRVAGTSLQGGHAWNKVLIDELWYVIDATWGGGKLTLNDVGYEALDFNDFMITELEKQNTFGCQGDTYNELLSNSEFDFYDNTSYTVSDYNFDLLIDNEEELSYLLEYYNNYYIANSMNYDYISLEFKINFEIGSSIGDEINNAKYLLGGRGIHLTNSSYFISGTATLGGIMSIIFY